MNNVPDWLLKVEERAGGKPVLLVEGVDDVDLLSYFLSQHEPGWDVRFYLADAGTKRRVIQAIKVHRPGWIGLVDRDEWHLNDVEVATKDVPRLLVLPRFCIESYFCVPEEIWVALPQIQRDRLGDDITELRQRLKDALPDWVAHGAMWRVLTARRGELLDDLGFPAQLINQPVTDRGEIRRILQTWHDRLNPDEILQDYDGELHTARELPPDELLKTYIHGKKFFRQIVSNYLDQLFSGQGRRYWMDRFRDAQIQPPPDLVALLESILALV